MFRQKFNRPGWGLMAGLIGPVVGFWGYYYIQLWAGQISHTPAGWWNFVAANSNVQSPVLSLSLIFNLILFFFFIWQKMDRAARGVLIATFIWAPVVIYFKYF